MIIINFKSYDKIKLSEINISGVINPYKDKSFMFHSTTAIGSDPVNIHKIKNVKIIFKNDPLRIEFKFKRCDSLLAIISCFWYLNELIPYKDIDISANISSIDNIGYNNNLKIDFTFEEFSIGKFKSGFDFYEQCLSFIESCIHNKYVITIFFYDKGETVEMFEWLKTFYLWVEDSRDYGDNFINEINRRKLTYAKKIIETDEEV